MTHPQVNASHSLWLNRTDAAPPIRYAQAEVLGLTAAQLTALAVAHAVAGVVMFQAPGLATLHALGTFFVGAYLALTRPPQWAACAAAYTVGGEVLWRLTHASIFWEFGKYATAGIMMIALYRLARPKLNGAAVMYFCLLVPSALITLSELDWSAGRQRVSFNLSGPFLLAVATIFFSNVSFTTMQIQRVFLALILPAVSVGAIGAHALLTATDISFAGESNLLASGGFGPNQVSTILGLAVFVAMLCIVDERHSPKFRVALGGLMVLLTIQCAMTFSRSGVYIAAGSIVVAMFYLVRLSKFRARVVQLLPVLLVVLALGWMYADRFTGGALSERFTDTTLTRRDQLIYEDWLLFLENPIFGTGPGLGQAARLGVPAHTEFTRVLSEHGSVGALALVVMVFMSVQRVLRTRSILERAYAASLLAWAFLYMAGNGMRIAAPALAFGMGFVNLVAARAWRQAQR